MYYYPTLVTFHVIFAGIWMIYFAVDIILKNQININNDLASNTKLISNYLLFSNFFGMIGSIGILITGILVVSLNPGFGFFNMTNNHWLAAKQIILVIILLITFISIIPISKKIRSAMNSVETANSTDVYSNLKKLFKLNAIVNGLVILNFLFAITHRYLG